MGNKQDYMPEPAFTADGQYALTSERKRYAAALAVLKCVEMMPQAYHSQGPAVVLENIRHSVSEFLDILRAAQRDEAHS